MRKYIIALTLVMIVLFTTIMIISRSNRSHNHARTQDHPTLKSLTDQQQLNKNTDTPTVSDDIVTVEDKTVHTDVSEAENDPDWLNDAQTSPSNQKESDPFTKHIVAQENKKDGTVIYGDPATKDPDVIRDVMFKTLVKKYGDIPVIHTFIDYDRKTQQSIPMTIDEEIEGLEALNKLFPSDTHRNNLKFFKWLKSKGATDGTLQDIGDITQKDIAYLRSIGIQVKVESTDDANSKITIITKKR